MSKRDDDRIRAAIARLEALCDPSDTGGCGVRVLSKLEVAPFVSSWVLPLLRDAVGRTPDRRGRSGYESALQSTARRNAHAALPDEKRSEMARAAFAYEEDGNGWSIADAHERMHRVRYGLPEDSPRRVVVDADLVGAARAVVARHGHDDCGDCAICNLARVVDRVSR